MSRNALDREWDAVSLLRFTLPTIGMMLFQGAYTITDTVFVAKLVDTDALSAINIVCPAVNLAVGLGTMLAAGGNAVISRKMGEGRPREAREAFTLLTLTAAAVGFALLAAGMFRLEAILRMLGASPRLLPRCRDYLGVLLLFFPANLLQTLFANLFVTAGRPGLGLGLSIAAGTANVALDWFFMVPCGFGIRGAALGTGCGYLIPAAAGILFFAQKKSPLAFTIPKWRWAVLRESCLNGSSELVSQLAAAVTTFLFNRAMLRLAGEDGVAAVTILIYTQFLLQTLFIGFSMGAAPVIGFQFGSGDTIRQRRVLQICLRFIAAVSLTVFTAARLGGAGIARLFAPEGSAVYRLAADGFAVFDYSFLFCGLNIFTSAWFTALSNGRLSAVLSFLRTFGLLAGGIVLLPRVWGLTGVWMAVPVAEAAMFCVSAVCLLYSRERDLGGNG